MGQASCPALLISDHQSCGFTAEGQPEPAQRPPTAFTPSPNQSVSGPATLLDLLSLCQLRLRLWRQSVNHVPFCIEKLNGAITFFGYRQTQTWLVSLVTQGDCRRAISAHHHSYTRGRLNPGNQAIPEGRFAQQRRGLVDRERNLAVRRDTPADGIHGRVVQGQNRHSPGHIGGAESTPLAAFVIVKHQPGDVKRPSVLKPIDDRSGRSARKSHPDDAVLVDNIDAFCRYSVMVGPSNFCFRTLRLNDALQRIQRWPRRAGIFRRLRQRAGQHGSEEKSKGKYLHAGSRGG